MKPHVLLRIRGTLRRLDIRRQRVEPVVPSHDVAFRQMLARLRAAEAERRLQAAESALNRPG